LTLTDLILRLYTHAHTHTHAHTYIQCYLINCSIIKIFKTYFDTTKTTQK
jgi:hypothetical protein